VDVHLPPTRIRHHEAHRRSAIDQFVSEIVEELDDASRLPKLGDEIEVVVHARLTLEERINSPAPVEPGVARRSASHRGHVDGENDELWTGYPAGCGEELRVRVRAR